MLSRFQGMVSCHKFCLGLERYMSQSLANSFKVINSVMIKFIAVLILTVSGSGLFAQSFEALNSEIEAKLTAKQYDAAAEKIEYALTNFDLNPLAEANLNHNLGLCKLEIGDYTGARKYLTQALDLKTAHYATKNADYAKTSQLLGDMYMEIGDYDRARNYLTESQLVIQNDLGESTDENVNALINLGQFYEAVGGFKTAHDYFDKALAISDRIHHKESEEYAEVLNHIGRIYIQNGELDLAEKNLIASNTIYASLGQDYVIEYVESMENLAMLYERQGKFADSEKMLLNIEQRKRQIPDLPEELLLETLNDLGILYMDLDNPDRAKQYFTEVKKASEKSLGSEHNFYATAINNLAAIAKRQRDFLGAKALLVEAKAIFERIYGAKHPQYANALNNLASIERILGNYETSETYYNAVLEIDKVIYGENHPNYATTLNNLGILYSSMGKLNTAGIYYQQAVEIRKATLGVNHPSYARSVENLGLHFFTLNNIEKAEEYLREAVDIQIGQITTIFPALTESERALFYDHIKEDVERYIYVAYQLLDSRPELIQNILNYQIATKGILFSSSERIRNAVFTSKDQDLISRYSKWEQAKVRLAGYYQLGEMELQRYGINIREVEQSIENMERDLMIRSEIFADLFNLNQTNWNDIRRTLKDDQALVEIVRFREFNSQSIESTGYFGFTDKVFYMFIILKSDSFVNPEVVVLENGAALESKGFSLYNNSVKYQSELRTSYLNYWASIHPKLKGSKHVIVSPDGVFFKMNPNVLNMGTDEYLIDSYYVTYVTNSKDLLQEQQTFGDQPSAVLIGNPDFGVNNGSRFFELDALPGSQVEVNELSALMQSEGWQVTKFIGSDASEVKLKSIHHPTVLHIATHGYFDDNDPVMGKISPGNNPMFKSGLFLQDAAASYGRYTMGQRQNPANDGILSSYEAMNIDLTDTRLVVLSACETALGDVELGEGVYGLQRAIMTAGAHNIITSMTKVEDEATQQLMTFFYKELLKSDQVIDAFRKAQFKLRERYPDPRVWGAFLLTGNG